MVVVPPVTVDPITVETAVVVEFTVKTTVSVTVSVYRVEVLTTLTVSVTL
jgi:hypothetical protein